MSNEFDPSVKHDIPALHGEGVSDPQTAPITHEEVEARAARLQEAPTGIPPVGQRDSDYRNEGHFNDNDTNKPLLSRGKKITAALLLTAAGLGIGGKVLSQGGNDNPLAEKPTTSATPLESYTPPVNYEMLVDPMDCPPITNDTEYAPVSVVECGNFTMRSEADRQRILRIEQTPLNEYAKLPFTDQYYYGSYLLKNRAGAGQTSVNEVLAKNPYAGMSLDGYMDTLPEVPGKSVINQIDLKLAALQSMRITDKSGVIVFDKENALKALPAVAVPGSKVYTELLNIIQNNPSKNSLSFNKDGAGILVFDNTLAAVISKDTTTINKSAVPKYTIRTAGTEGTSLGSLSTSGGYTSLELAQVQPEKDGQSTVDYLLLDIKS